MSHTDAHDHPEFLAHHFDNPKQQFEAGKLGMWLFLATEVLLFGGLFCAYAIWRGNHPELFKYGSQFLDTTMGATNTAVLILSSLTMAWAVTAIQQNKQRLTLILLGLTLCGAVTFMVIKYFEYTHKFHEGIFPGLKFYEAPDPEVSHWWVAQGDDHAATADGAVEVVEEIIAPSNGPEAEATTVLAAAVGPTGLADESIVDILGESFEERHEGDHPDHPLHPLQDPDRPHAAHMFFNIYFMMTGLHGIHVIIGGVVIAWIFIRTRRGEFSSEYFTPVDLGGLYWHVVDLIWIFLFPLFYLI